MKSSKSDTKAESEKSTEPHQNTRETAESIIIAFILAFLFRAFVAEAFVIPTGSMAPTLMGAHKDIQCEYCGDQFQNTASLEFEQESGKLTNRVAIAGYCSNCRAENAYDFAGNGNHATFSGDRILVSKFDYIFRDPNRWDVLVFKYPNDARMNYIKRLIGLPGEHLRIELGDIYTRKGADQPWQIARKPPHKIVAMSQVVYDSEHLAPKMISAGWPSLWQPWPAPAAESTAPTGWQVNHQAQGWSAEVKPGKSTNTQWLRYFHQYLDSDSWEQLARSNTPTPTAPYNVNLITDYLAYNTTVETLRGNVYSGASKLHPKITRENRAIHRLNESRNASNLGKPPNDGLHWVGDLAAEFAVEIAGQSGIVSLDLVEFGLHFRCDIDVASGKASLKALDRDQSVEVFGNSVPTAQTRVRGPGRYRLRIANFDDRIVLWVNGWPVKFDRSTDYDSHRWRSADQRRPHWSPQDPMDAAPIGIGAKDVDIKLDRAQVWRDIYYIAGHQNFSRYSDYDLFDSSLVDGLPDPELRNEINNFRIAMDMRTWLAISATYSQPEWWAKSNLFGAKRNRLEFQLEAEQFFPMGDNSAASSDARAWTGHNYVERRFIVGKALLVFFPHYWRAPIPFLPNIGRMRLIR